MASIWVLTTEVNEYDQVGEYFSAAWSHKPSKAELASALPTALDDLLVHVLNGGGRQDAEYAWHFLRELQEGEGL